MVIPVDEAAEQREFTAEIATAVRHSFVYGIGGILIKAISFLLLPFYTHYLSPSDYGILELLDLSMSLLGMFLNMGITAALLRYYGMAPSDVEKRTVVGSIFFFALATAILISIGGAFFVPKISGLMFGPSIPSKYLFFSFGGFVFAYIANIPYTYLRAKEASGTLVTLDTICSLGMLALNIYFIAILNLSILGVLLSALIVNVLRIGVLTKWMQWGIGFSINFRLLRKVLIFGAPLIFSNLTIFVLNFSDRFFLQRFQSLEVVGIYAVGYKFGYLLNVLFIQPFNMMWQARMYTIRQRLDHQKVFAQVLVFYSVILIFAALALALFSSEVIRVMVDVRYAAGQSVIPIVVLAYVCLGVGYYVQLGMFLMERTGLIGVVSMIAAVVNLGFNYLLILHFGMLGAAWATLFGFLTIVIGSYYYSQRVCPLQLELWRVSKIVTLATIIYLLSTRFTLSSLTVSLVAKAMFLASFPVLIWLTRLLSTEELRTLNFLKERGVTFAMRRFKPVRLVDSR